MALTDAKQVGNALFGWPFRCEVTGWPVFYVKKFALPESEFEVANRGGAGQRLDRKEAGGRKIGEWTMETEVPAEGTERKYWEEWAAQVETRDVKAYYRDMTVILLGPNNNPAMTWDLEDSWPSKVKVTEFDTEDKKKQVRISITGQCNDCVLRIS